MVQYIFSAYTSGKQNRIIWNHWKPHEIRRMRNCWIGWDWTKLYSPLGLNIFFPVFSSVPISGTPEDENIRNPFSLQHELFFISLWKRNLERAAHCLKQYFESKKLIQRKKLFLMINAATKDTNLCWKHLKILFKCNGTVTPWWWNRGSTLNKYWQFLCWTYLTHFYWGENLSQCIWVLKHLLGLKSVGFFHPCF